jgi:hypothetical protein
LGDRLEKPGKERMTVTGTLTRLDDPQPIPFSAILQFPDHLRLTMQLGARSRILTFDGNTAHSDNGSPDSREQDLIESMVYDTAEHFFAGQALGTLTRFLGDHFRIDDGTDADYTGPYYDVYQTSEHIKNSAVEREQTKLYWFNSNTLLLERVTYLIEASQTPVEIRISGWRQILGHQLPSRIVRLENSKPSVSFTIDSTSLSPKQEDGIFEQ